jgi:hypothetical protein
LAKGSRIHERILRKTKYAIRYLAKGKTSY